MKAIYLTTHFKDANHLQLAITEKPKPKIQLSECLVRVASSGVNPSDVLGALGYFKHAVLPRIPGRDFAGTIVDGEVDLIGKQVWGSGGAAGIDFDGTHAEYIAIPARACAEIPKNLDLITAGALPLPYITAYYGLVTRAKIKARETVLVIGALGQVGQAAMSICQWKNCKVIAVVRGEEELQTAKLIFGWEALDSTDAHFAENILAINEGKPINVVLNSVGNILWEDFSKALAPFGRIITIAAREGERQVQIDLFNLYRNNQDLININTVGLDYIANAHLLNELKPGFEAGKLLPLQVPPAAIFSLQAASQAYQMVANGSKGMRVLLNLSEE